MAVNKVPSVAMSNGLRLPLLGYGTWLAKDPAQLREALRTAIDVGYRLIDTAYLYGNESVIGDVLQEYYDAGKLTRGDVFITTKLPPFYHRLNDVPLTVERQLKALRTTYIDLYLIHSPCPCKKDPSSEMFAYDKDGQVFEEDVEHTETWQALESLYDAGTLKSIGISNFSAKQITALYDAARVKPHNLQVECHLLWPQNELLALCQERGITFTAYAPLGSPGRKVFNPNTEWPEGDVLGHPTVLAIAKKHGKTPAQVLLRQLIQRGISAIPKSVTPSRVKENFGVVDFALDSEDLAQLEAIGPHVRLFPMKFRIKHSKYPYDDVLEAEELGAK